MIKRLTKIARSLANEKRILIIRTLIQKKEMSVSEISEELNFPLKTISRHLRVLDGADLTRHRRSGNQVYYSLALKPKDPTHKKIISLFLKLF